MEAGAEGVAVGEALFSDVLVEGGDSFVVEAFVAEESVADAGAVVAVDVAVVLCLFMEEDGVEGAVAGAAEGGGGGLVGDGAFDGDFLLAFLLGRACLVVAGEGFEDEGDVLFLRDVFGDGLGGGVLPGGFFSSGGALFRGEAEPFAGFGEGEGGFEGDVGAEGDAGVVRGVEVDEPLFGFVFAAGSGDACDGVVEPGVAVVGGVEEGGVGGGDFVDFAAGEFGAEDGFEGEHGLGVGHALVGEGGEAAAEAGGFGDAGCRAVGGGVGFGDSGLYLTGGVFCPAPFVGKADVPGVAPGEGVFEEVFHGGLRLREAHAFVVAVGGPGEEVGFVPVEGVFVFFGGVVGFESGEGVEFLVGGGFKHAAVEGEAAVVVGFHFAAQGLFAGLLFGVGGVDAAHGFVPEFLFGKSGELNADAVEDVGHDAVEAFGADGGEDGAGFFRGGGGCGLVDEVFFEFPVDGVSCLEGSLEGDFSVFGEGGVSGGPLHLEAEVGAVARGEDVAGGGDEGGDEAEEFRAFAGGGGVLFACGDAVPVFGGGVEVLEEVGGAGGLHGGFREGGDEFPHAGEGV